MKLAVSGSSGIGKTTLAKRLAERLDVVCIDEHYDCLFDASGKFIEPETELRKLIFELLEHKQQLETDSSSFVSDRCPVDLFNLWLSRGFARYSAETIALYKRCRRYIQAYDTIVVLPWGGIPFRQVDDLSETRRRRVMNQWVQLHNQATIIGLLIQWVPFSKILPISADIKDASKRTDFVIEKIGRGV